MSSSYYAIGTHSRSRSRRLPIPVIEPFTCSEKRMRQRAFLFPNLLGQRHGLICRQRQLESWVQQGALVRLLVPNNLKKKSGHSATSSLNNTTVATLLSKSPALFKFVKFSWIALSFLKQRKVARKQRESSFHYRFTLTLNCFSMCKMHMSDRNVFAL